MTRVLALALVPVWLACAQTTDFYAGSDTKLASQQGGSTGGGLAAVPSGVQGGNASPPPMDAGTSTAPDAAPPPVVVVCATGTGDCDAVAVNGCEIDLLRDKDHCGACGNACTAPDCACMGGAFATVCGPGRADCDGDARNGCEVDTAGDLRHCGGCGQVCHADGHDALNARCVQARCELTCQNAPYEIDCDGDPDNGCEAYIRIDSENCGACGMRCTCLDGRCI